MIFTGLCVFCVMIVWWSVFYLKYRPRNIAKKVVLITGGGSGIGRLMALKFATKGATVVLWDVNKDGMKRVQTEITGGGGQCTIHTVDVTDRELVYQTAKTIGFVDILVNNAGIVTGKTILDCPDELMVKTMEVNTISHFWTIKAFLPAMMEKNTGHIVTIASAAGTCGVAGLVDYCASKFGAVGIAESLYMELQKRPGNKILTTLACPYYINTGMFDGVQSKWPLLLPILEEQYVANRIVKAIVRGEEQICLPWFVNVGMLAKILPVPWQLWVSNFMGLNAGMDAFKGHQGKKE
jgi:all-trans-retinol dehydrogenase (NAD+)